MYNSTKTNIAIVVIAICSIFAIGYIAEQAQTRVDVVCQEGC